MYLQNTLGGDLGSGQSGHFYFALTRFGIRCRCKMRIADLSKVEMSAFIGGRGRHGNRANRFELARTGPVAPVTRARTAIEPQIAVIDDAKF